MVYVSSFQPRTRHALRTLRLLPRVWIELHPLTPRLTWQSSHTLNPACGVPIPRAQHRLSSEQDAPTYSRMNMHDLRVQ